MNHTIQWAEDHNSIELPLIIVPHDPSEGGKTTGTRAQPSHAAIDVYRPTVTSQTIGGSIGSHL